MTFLRYYLSMLLSGGEHSTAVSYARNMTTARKQAKELARRRAERIHNLKCPFKESP